MYLLANRNITVTVDINDALDATRSIEQETGQRDLQRISVRRVIKVSGGIAHWGGVLIT